MNARAILNSRFGVETALWLGRTLPTRTGHALADAIAGLISRRGDLAPVRAVRCNQFVVRDRQAGKAELDQLVRATFRSAARCIFDFYHWMDNPQALMTQVVVEPSFQDIIEQTIRQERATILALPHVANFDLVGRAVAQRGMRFQAITPPAPPGGYQLQNKLRSQAGMEATPASMEAVRQATQRLKAGGCVVTGVDRPVPEAKVFPHFFGHPASLPLAHIRLALRLDLPVYVVGVAQDEASRYHIWSSGPVAMQRCPDADEELVANAETILSMIEKNIRDYSVQWNMTYPVWPELLDDMP